MFIRDRICITFKSQGTRTKKNGRARRDQGQHVYVACFYLQVCGVFANICRVFPYYLFIWPVMEGLRVTVDECAWPCVCVPRWKEKQRVDSNLTVARKSAFESTLRSLTLWNNKDAALCERIMADHLENHSRNICPEEWLSIKTLTTSDLFPVPFHLVHFET